jgi:hypothetical protein
VAFPDIEILLVAYLHTKTSLRVVTDLPANLDEILPVIRVTRISGADRDYRLDRPIVDVDVFAADRAGASALSGQVRDLLRNQLQYGDAVQPTGVVTSVETIAGPRWLPDPNTSLRRFNATYELCVHA